MNLSNIHNKVVCLDVNLWAVLDTLPEYIAVVDRDGMILYLNATWYQLLLERAVGFEGFNVGSNFIANFANAFGSGNPEDISLIQNGLNDVTYGIRDQFTHEYVHYQSGVRHWYTINIIPTYITNGTRGVIIQQTDSTRRKQEVEVLHAQASLFQVLSSAAEQFLQTAQIQPTLQQMLRHLGELMGISCAFACANNTISGCVEVCTTLHSRTGKSYENGHTTTVPSQYANVPRWSYMLSQGLPIYGTQQTFQEEEQPVLAQRRVLSLALIPIFVDTQWWGYIGFEDSIKHHMWSEEERDVLQRAAAIFGAALRRNGYASEHHVYTL